jgi:hypothetical protein
VATGLRGGTADEHLPAAPKVLQRGGHQPVLVQYLCSTCNTSPFAKKLNASNAVQYLQYLQYLSLWA